MSSKELKKARDYECKEAANIKESDRPLFHLTPFVGWMNDPNGFSYYKGKYHLFYQYYPYETNWGPMHWGHACTKDFIKWEFLPAALAPDQEYDALGCWSGSAFELADGTHALIYTGLTEDSKTASNVQTQCLAIGNGVDYIKSNLNPVIGGDLLPQGGSKLDFRDPKFWYDKDENLYYLVAGNRTEDGSGAALLFQSKDLKEWKFITTLDSSKNQYGKMWECPDFFSLDGSQVLLVSPQEMRAKELEFHNGNNSICIIGSYDKANHKFTRESVQSVDQGLDFYAPQTIETPDGRRVMIGWMQSWESCRNQPQNCQFMGTMTIPRELSVKNGRLLQTPVREIEKYRKNQVIYDDVVFEDKIQLDGINGRILDMEIDLETPNATNNDSVTIRIAKDQENDSIIQYFPEEGIIRFDRTNCGFNCDIQNVRKAVTSKGKLKMRVLMDKYSVEIFLNEGERVLTSTFYTPLNATDITFEATAQTHMNIKKWDLVFIQK